jgi:hypothetical protein
VTDRHKSRPKAVRMPDGLLAWYEQHAKAAGGSVNASLVAALEEYRAWRDSGSTTSAPKRPRRTDSAPAATFRPPAPRSHALNCKCGICKPR